MKIKNPKNWYKECGNSIRKEGKTMKDKKCMMFDIDMKQCRNKAMKNKKVLLDNELYNGTQYVKIKVCKRCFDLLNNYQTLYER